MKYFHIKALTHSKEADDMKIDNTAPTYVIANLTNLSNKILEPLREMYGKSIYIKSGYKCPLLCTLTKDNSNRHIKGQEVDITGDSKEENKKIFDIIKNHFSFDSITLDKDCSLIHVSYVSNEKNRNEVVII